MSIFARREIQKRLDAFASIVGKKKLRKVVKTLNIEGSKSNEKRLLESLATAWEVAIVSAFAASGDTKYEKEISNGKQPDIFFCDQGISLIADVVAVSDDQQHKKNPVDDFSAIIRKLWMELGPRKGSLSWRIEAVDLQPSVPPQNPALCWPLRLSSRLRPINRGSLKRIALPPSNGLNEYLRMKVCPFFEELRAFPDAAKNLDIDDQYSPEITVRFSITYTPKGTGLSGSYPSYTTITDIESHVLWRRLIEKSGQFALAAEEVPRVLFVCDAGCAALADSLGGGATEYRLEEVLGHFWRRPQSSEDQNWSWITENDISAVLVLSIEAVSTPFFIPGRGQFILKARLFTNPHCRFPLNETSTELLRHVVSKLPTPIESPPNVLRAVSVKPIASRHMGGFMMKHNCIEMSGVELLRILSGELSLEDFCRKYGLHSNPFKDALMTFRTIKSVKVEPLADRDDDKIIIEFGTHDAATGPFIVPEAGPALKLAGQPCVRCTSP
jgi:hypothetical protein